MKSGLDPNELARERQRRRRAAGRARAWSLHERVAAGQRVTRVPGRVYNKLEARFAKLLDEWGADWEWQFRLGEFVYDFRVAERLLVEVHGRRWHPDPARTPVEQMTSTQRRRLLHDIDKKHNAARRGFVLRVVWEDDLRANRVRREQMLG
ncbi:MAG: hypothetical protein R6X13_03565 [bacterium]